MRTIAAVCLLASSLACAGCGGSSTPAAPSAASSLPVDAGFVCAALAGRATSSMIGIFNGAACPTDNSAVVLLNMRDRNNGAVAACSGTIITPRAVLTAAHCLGGETALVKVYRGSGLQVDSVSFEAYPGYRENDTTALDVGVVLTGEDLARPGLPLLTSRDARVGESAVIAGWGLDQNNVGTTLRAGTTAISAVGRAFLQTRFTSSGSGSGVCGGDSGGPLLLSEGGVWAIAGVTSGTSDAGCRNDTNFFANLRNPEIQAFIRNLVPDAPAR